MHGSVSGTTLVEGSPATITADQITQVTVTNSYETATPHQPSLPQTGTTANLGMAGLEVVMLLLGAGALLVAGRRSGRTDWSETDIS